MWKALVSIPAAPAARTSRSVAGATAATSTASHAPRYVRWSGAGVRAAAIGRRPTGAGGTGTASAPDAGREPGSRLSWGIGVPRSPARAQRAPRPRPSTRSRRRCAMYRWKTAVGPTVRNTKILVTDPDGRELLKAVLPPVPGHPRTPLSRDRCVAGVWAAVLLRARTLSTGASVASGRREASAAA